MKETLDATLVEGLGESSFRTLNQYVFERELGVGANGRVSLARDGHTLVAIKEFSKRRLRKLLFGTSRRPQPAVQTGHPLDLIKGEVAILKKLRHPNIVTLIEVLDDPTQDGLFMVFELCDNVIMDFNIDKPKPLPIATALDYFRQLILGIEYLHAHDIAHRDIKPENLMISNGVIKIVDFGVSEFFIHGEETVDKVAGSPAFYAPELCGVKAVDRGHLPAIACDIWSMGVTLYCMVFGILPFKGDGIVDLFECIKSKELVFPAGLQMNSICTEGSVDNTHNIADKLKIQDENDSLCINTDLVDLLFKMLNKNHLYRIKMSEIRVNVTVYLGTSLGN